MPQWALTASGVASAGGRVSHDTVARGKYAANGGVGGDNKVFRSPPHNRDRLGRAFLKQICFDLAWWGFPPFLPSIANCACLSSETSYFPLRVGLDVPGCLRIHGQQKTPLKHCGDCSSLSS